MIEMAVPLMPHMADPRFALAAHVWSVRRCSRGMRGPRHCWISSTSAQTTRYGNDTSTLWSRGSVVWYGMARCGMVWFGMVWNGMVGVMWYSMVWCDVV